MIVIVTIYADVLLFFLFISDYMLLKLIAKILKKKTTELKLILGAVIGSFFSLLVRIFYNDSILIKLGMLFLIGAFMLKLCFEIRDKHEFLKCYFVLFLASFCMGGVNEFVMQNKLFRQFAYQGVFLTMTLWFGYLFIRKGIKMMKEFVLHRSQNAEVCLKIRGKKAYCKGFWDSGNSLRDPITGKAVVLLEKAILEKYQIPIPVKGFRVIPFHSIGMENGVLKGFVADELLIKDENGYERCFQKIVVAIYEGKLSIKEDYQMILSPNL